MDFGRIAAEACTFGFSDLKPVSLSVKIGHDRTPEAVGGNEVRQARIEKLPLQHLPQGARDVCYKQLARLIERGVKSDVRQDASNSQSLFFSVANI